MTHDGYYSPHNGGGYGMGNRTESAPVKFQEPTGILSYFFLKSIYTRIFPFPVFQKTLLLTFYQEITKFRGQGKLFLYKLFVASESQYT